MSSRPLIAASTALGVAIGLPAGLTQWSNASVQIAIGLGAIGAVAAFIALPDLLRRR